MGGRMMEKTEKITLLKKVAEIVENIDDLVWTCGVEVSFDNGDIDIDLCADFTITITRDNKILISADYTGYDIYLMKKIIEAIEKIRKLPGQG